MKKLYDKSELLFSLTWIAIYCVLQSLAFSLNDTVGIKFSFSALFAATQTIILYLFLRRHGLFQRYGIRSPQLSAKRFVFYIPLLILISGALWNGIGLRYTVVETGFYICLMACVGFLEELIFRGFLFRAMAEESLRQAIVVSSVTFGIGHIVNSVNGSGQSLTVTLLQIVFAIAVGFLFVTIVYRGGSLWPCIITHQLINISEGFTVEADLTLGKNVLYVLTQMTVIIVYILILNRTLPKGLLMQS
ncbi:CPBP family intramembrane glutamic endopeptidase [Corynebacterium glucuronolyticum]|uniref:CPBP family intramembrane glutamic endopeptidase n=1 Tax=Corynebacterium glucuronolyticum TaxID=39791 RepID=UPI00223B0D85|nr:CPBP family intramembrane glutamic endopeptidase [Corynebacterium glucuronolyticum]MCT1563908.1 CPBP family intramembrane metalloprotease [Corynebacterium glucuronolyticum]